MSIEYDCLCRCFKLENEEANKASHTAFMAWDEFICRIYSIIMLVVSESPGSNIFLIQRIICY